MQPAKVAWQLSIINVMELKRLFSKKQKDKNLIQTKNTEETEFNEKLETLYS